MTVPFLERALFCSTLFLFCAIGAGAQTHDPVPEPTDPEETVPDSAVGVWHYDASARLNVSQAAYKDWEEGAGHNSLALSAGLGGTMMREGEHWIQAHEMRFGFGLINQEGRELRKAEDQIRWNSSLRYQGDDFFRLFNPTMAVNLRTQFVNGYDYTSNPFEEEVPEGDPRAQLEPPVRTSSFLAPAFVTESLGLTYEPISDFTLRLGVASKQTVVQVRDFRVLYSVSDRKVARWEGGAEFASALDKRLAESIHYQSQLNVFFSLNQTEQLPDALWENTISLRVNDWLSTDLVFVALYDQDITKAIQLKETISIGLSFTLL